MRALDLFCGAGGATKGLQRAGFHVTGIDNRPQPRYCGDLFIQGDALRPPVRLEEFDFIWASPVCKAFTDGARGLAKRTGREHPNQIPATRSTLEACGVPWVIENVPRAPIRPDLKLHGHMFGLEVIRKRHFELSWPGPILTPPLPRGLLREGYICAVGNGTPAGVREMGLPDATTADWREALGIDWMNRDEMSQAIPPAYSEFIGRAALQYLKRAAA